MTRIGSLCSGYGGLDMAVCDVLDARVAWHAELPPITGSRSPADPRGDPAPGPALRHRGRTHHPPEPTGEKR